MKQNPDLSENASPLSTAARLDGHEVAAHPALRAWRTQGFTLIEMLIVVAIIGMIATFVGGQVLSKFDKAKVDSTKIQMRQLSVVLDDYRRECNRYPTADQGLQALLTAPTSEPKCKNYNPDGYLKGNKVPHDAWDGEFQYQSDGNKFTLISLGRDGKEGGEGLDADINSDELDK